MPGINIAIHSGGSSDGDDCVWRQRSRVWGDDDNDGDDDGNDDFDFDFDRVSRGAATAVLRLVDAKTCVYMYWIRMRMCAQSPDFMVLRTCVS